MWKSVQFTVLHCLPPFLTHFARTGEFMIPTRQESLDNHFLVAQGTLFLKLHKCSCNILEHTPFLTPISYYNTRTSQFYGFILTTPPWNTGSASSIDATQHRYSSAVHYQQLQSVSLSLVPRKPNPAQLHNSVYMEFVTQNRGISWVGRDP